MLLAGFENLDCFCRFTELNCVSLVTEDSALPLLLAGRIALASRDYLIYYWSVSVVGLQMNCLQGDVD